MRRRYRNSEPSCHRPRWPSILRWGVWDRLTARRRRPPAGPPAPRVAPDLDLVWERSPRPRLTWIGHSSFLLSLGGTNLLVDPVFARRAGLAYRRFAPPGLEAEDLPPIDAVLVTHSHHDHLDAGALALLPGVPAIVPAGVGRWLRRREVRELDWWNATRVGTARITLVPACHWSRRRFADTNRSLWGGFLAEGGGVSVYHAGDSGFFGGFAEVGRRFPSLTAAAMPVGGYGPAWFTRSYHMTPEQAGEAFLACGARLMVPMHYGAFRLSDEPLLEPLERLRAWWAAHGPRDGRRLAAMAVGETIVLGEGSARRC